MSGNSLTDLAERAANLESHIPLDMSFRTERSAVSLRARNLVW